MANQIANNNEATDAIISKILMYLKDIFLVSIVLNCRPIELIIILSPSTLIKKSNFGSW